MHPLPSGTTKVVSIFFKLDRAALTLEVSQELRAGITISNSETLRNSDPVIVQLLCDTGKGGGGIAHAPLV